MLISRRKLMMNSAAIGILPSLMADPELIHALAATVTQPSRQPTVGETFWSNLYPSATHRGHGNSKTPNEDRQPRILQFNEKSGLRWGDRIGSDELPDFTDDAVVTMELSGFRPGSEDKSRLSKVRFAQLHLSCQRVTFSEFVGPLAWASLATIFSSNAKKLPAVTNLEWNPEAPGHPETTTQSGNPKLSHMLLSQGAGHMTVNITTTPTTSLLDKILGTTLQATRALSPLLGFPAISVPALQAFYDFYGKLEQADAHNFLLNTTPMDVAVTKQGLDNPNISQNALKLVSGDYFMVPKEQEEDLTKDIDKLTVRNGFLVERDSKASPDDQISEAVPTVSYVSLSVRVQSASSVPQSTTVTEPLLDATPQSSGETTGNQSSGTTTGKKSNTQKSH